MRVRVMAAVALAALVTTGATGCGDGSGEDGDSGQDPTMDPTSAAVEWAECMREHGVDMPDPDLDGGDGQQGLTLPDPDDPGYQEATEACRDFVPEGL